MPPKEKAPGPIPEEALAYFRGKKLKPGFDYRDVWKEEHRAAFTVAKVMETDVLEDVRELVERSLKEGLTFRNFQKEIAPMLDRSGWSDYHKETPKKRRLATIYDTNMRVARIPGQWQRIERTKTVLPFLTYALGPSVRHREEHVAWAGTTLPIDDPWWNDHVPPNGWACFHSSTMISGDVTGVSKARYSGEMIEVRTLRGARLAVTPNHPIATTKGWIAAGALKIGDHCIGNSREVELIRLARCPDISARAVNNQEIPTSIKDVFDALATHGWRTTEVSPLDFHGEARLFDGEIDIVGSYVTLRLRIKSFLSELINKGLLSRSNLRLAKAAGICGKELLAFGFWSSGGGDPCRSAIVRDLFRSHFLKSQQRRFGAPSHVYPMIGQQSVNRGPGDTEFLRELLARNPGQISIDHVIRIRRFPFSGHVFDLQSVSGWLWTNSIMASNCKCRIRQVGEREVERKGGPTKRPPSYDVPWENKKTGKTEMVPVGIDPGWNYHVGKDRMKGIRDAERDVR